MATVGNVLGRTRYVDIPVSAGSTSATWTTTRGGLDLIGIQVYSKGLTATTLSVGGSSVAGGAISSFTNGYGQKMSAAPSSPVPVSTHTGTTDGYGQQANSTGVGNVNFASSGVIQGTTSTLVDRQSQYNGAPALLTPTDVTPISSDIADSTAIVVGFTGTPAVDAKWSEVTTVYLNGSEVAGYEFPGPGASVLNGWIQVFGAAKLSSALSTGSAITSIPVAALTVAVPSGADIVLTSSTNTQTFVASASAAVGDTSISVTSQTPNYAYPTTSQVSIQGTTSTIPSDSIPFQVAASDTQADTVAGYVRLVFQLEAAAAPDGPSVSWPATPTNGVNAPGDGTNAGTGTFLEGTLDVGTDDTSAAGENADDAAPVVEGTDNTNPTEQFEP